MTNNLTLRDLEPSVLYDIFYETGTRLIGTLVNQGNQALNANNQEEATRIRQQVFNLKTVREQVEPFDTTTQIHYIHEWTRQAEELSND